MFDYIILRQEKHLRGRTEENILSLLIDGIKSVDPNKKYEVIPKEVDAIKHAMSLTKPGTFITALSDVISNAIETVQNYQEQERNGLFNV
jgi:cyanophycin synthetase